MAKLVRMEVWVTPKQKSKVVKEARRITKETGVKDSNSRVVRDLLDKM